MITDLSDQVRQKRVDQFDQVADLDDWLGDED